MYRKTLSYVLWSVLRAVLLAAVLGGAIGGLLAGIDGAINGALFFSAFGLTGGVLGLLRHFFLDDSEQEADLRWHRGGSRRDDDWPS